MDTIRLIHIAPELPPKVGGVADYTSILSRRLVEVSDGVVEPVLVHAGNQETDAIEADFPAVDLSGQCSAPTLAGTIHELAREATGGVAVVLEYTGFGYAKRGAPVWLHRGLRRGCGDEGYSMVTVFHELYSMTYKPWTTTFWTRPIQKYVASRIACLSTGIMANWDDAAQWLEQRVDGTPVRVNPSFSNVGEPEHLPSHTNREPYAVAFGGSGMKAELYEKWGEELSPILQKAGLERIVDIGSKVPKQKYSHVQVPVDSKGILPKEEVSRYLQTASVGLLTYPLHCLKKSGIWGGYAAHGLPTLLGAERESGNDLTHGKHFFLLGCEVEGTKDQFSEVSRTARRWYRENASSWKAANRILSCCKAAASR